MTTPDRRCTIPNCGRPHVARGYCGAHYRRWREGKPLGPLRTDPPELRIEALMDRSGDCWLWLGHITAQGYGRLTRNNKGLCAHRVVYEVYVGPIPDGAVLDHLCRNPACVNPAHLEPVTDHTNVVIRGHTVTAANARKTHCKRGHPFDNTNTVLRRDGTRECRTCDRARRRSAHRTDEQRKRHAERERARRARMAAERKEARDAA